MSVLTSSFSRGLRFNKIAGAVTILTVAEIKALPNLEVWYDAETADATTFNSGVITSGTEVTSWHNKGGLSSHDWNSTGGQRPEWFSNVQNSLGAVRFNAPTDDADTDERITINPIAYLQSLAGTTMFLVMRTESTATGTRLACSTDTSGFRWGQNGSTWIGGHAGATFTVDSHTVDTNFHIVTTIYDGTATGNSNRFKLRFDQTDATLTFTGTVNATTSASASSFYGGVGETGNTQHWIGDIAELILFKRTLTTSEVADIEGYLANKWAL